MNSITSGTANLKYILIVLFFAVLSGGIIFWQYSELQKEKISPVELRIPESGGTVNEKKYEGDISDWLVLENDKYHYRIKYPKEATISSMTGSSSTDNGVNIILSSSKEETSEETIVYENFGINVVENPEKLSGEEWVAGIEAESKKAYDAGEAPYEWAPIKSESILINGISAYRIVNFGFDGHYETAYISKDEFMYILGGYPVAEENPNYIDAVELYAVLTSMLNTFEFTK